jgi:hypothetical protein
MRGILIVALVILLKVATAQETLIVLNDSTKIKTEITALSDNLLFTKAGSFNISEVFSVRFASEEEYQRKRVMGDVLRSYPIKVYSGNKQLPAVVARPRPAVEDSAEKPETYFQENGATESYTPKGDFGVGIGLDYGGLGGRITYLPVKRLGLFFAGGYAFAGFGYNAGFHLRAAPDKRVSFIANLMYGYNAAIQVSGAPQFDKLYYGASITAGVMLRSRRDENNFFTIELGVPFRSQAFDNDYTSLRNNPSVRMGPVSPVTFSLGYHFGF